MCDACESEVRSLLESRHRFQLANRRTMEITRVEGDDVYTADHGDRVAFHASHAAALRHWLREGHYVCAIGSGTTSVKTLLGKGKLAKCSRCANDASHVWALVAVMKGVRRDQQTGLAPDPMPR